MYGIASVRPLPFKFPPGDGREMTDEGKRSYEALPQDARDELDQYLKPPKQYDDDEDVWNYNVWKSKPRIRQKAPKPLPYGTLACFQPKTHLDFHDPSYSKPPSDEEFRAWKRYRESLPPDMQRWLNSYDDPNQNQAKNMRKYEEDNSDRKKYNSNTRYRKYEEEESDRKKHNSNTRYRDYEEEKSDRKKHHSNTRYRDYEEEKSDRKKHHSNTRYRNYEEEECDRKKHHSNTRYRNYEEEESDRKKHNNNTRNRKYEDRSYNRRG